MKRLILITALMLSAGLTGCASIGDEMIACETMLRNKILAQKAWGHWSWCYGDIDYPCDFAKGFKAGYNDILQGGSGCQPTLPPQLYWKPDYQTPEGHSMIHAWFDGFSHGALAAKQDGYGGMGEIPISPTARANMEAARVAEQSRYMNGATPVPSMMGGEFGGGMIGLPQTGGNIMLPETDTTGQPVNGDEVVTPPVRPYE